MKRHRRAMELRICPQRISRRARSPLGVRLDELRTWRSPSSGASTTRGSLLPATCRKPWTMDRASTVFSRDVSAATGTPRITGKIARTSAHSTWKARIIEFRFDGSGRRRQVHRSQDNDPGEYQKDSRYNTSHYVFVHAVTADWGRWIRRPASQPGGPAAVRGFTLVPDYGNSATV